MEDHELASEIAGMIMDEIGNDRLYRAGEDWAGPTSRRADMGETSNVTIFQMDDGREVKVTVEVMP